LAIEAAISSEASVEATYLAAIRKPNRQIPIKPAIATAASDSF
jgi:hypothetical protein